MNVCICCRVSSERQQDTSIPMQDQFLREFCERGVSIKDTREKLTIIPPPTDFRTILCKKNEPPFVSAGFAFSESAFKQNERVKYHNMLDWIVANKDRHQIKALLFHRLDRSLRNLWDAATLPEWGKDHGIQIVFSDQPWDLLDSPSGRMMFGMMAVVSTYHSDNLGPEIRKGFKKIFNDGWPVSRAPFGAMNNPDKKSSTKILHHPERGPIATRMFHWYADGAPPNEIEERLGELGHPLSASQVRECLRNPFYIGRIEWDERTKEGIKEWATQGKHEPFIDMVTWERVQARLDDRNTRRARGPAVKNREKFTFHSGMIRSVDGTAMTPDELTRRGRTYSYYRCRGKCGGRALFAWKAAALEEAVARELDKLTMPQDLQELFAYKLRKILAAESEFRRADRTGLQSRSEFLKTRLDRLLDMRIDSELSKEAYDSKRDAVQAELDGVRKKLIDADARDDRSYEMISEAFEVSQGLGKLYRASDTAKKRRIVESVCSKLSVDATTLYVDWLSPFKSVVNGGGQRAFLTKTSPFPTEEPSIFDAWKDWSPASAAGFLAAVR